MNNLIGSNTTLSSPACAICNRTDYDQGLHSMVRTLCQEPHFFHKLCIYDSWYNSTAGDIRERSCYVCKETILRLIDVNCPGKQAEPGTLTERPAANILPQHSDPRVLLLFDAAEKGNIERLKMLIDQKVDVNASCKDGTTPLHIAICNGHTSIVKALIGKRADHLSVLIDIICHLPSAIKSVRQMEKIDVFIKIIKCGVKIYTLLSDLFSNLADVNAARTTNGETPLHIATGRSNVKCLEILIHSGGKVNSQLKTGETPLHIAAGKGDINCLKALAGYVPNTKENLQTICDQVIKLLEDAKEGKIKYPKDLLKQDLIKACVKAFSAFKKQFRTEAKINLPQADGKTPLHLAAENGHRDCLDWLLLKGAKIRPAEDGTIPLHLAAKNGHLECLRYLVKFGSDVDVNATNKNGETALHMAAKNGCTKNVKALLYVNGINVKQKDKYGRTALHAAAPFGHTKAIQTLLNFDPSLAKEKDNDGLEALELAEKCHCEEAIQTLKNFVPNRPLGQPALHTAASQGDIEDIQKLLENDRSLAKEKDKWGETALHHAAGNGQTEAIEKLLEIDGSQAKEKDKWGETALHAAARNGQTMAIQKLLTMAPLLLEVKDNCGKTALHAAAENGHTEAIQRLLTIAPLLAEVKDNCGETALYVAAENGHTEAIQQLLTIAPLLAEVKDNCGETALHVAAENGHTEAIQRLLTKAPLLAKKKDKWGQTALHAAARQGQTEAIQKLLEIERSLVKGKDILGETALHKAARQGQTKAIQTLLNFEPSLAKEVNNYGNRALYFAIRFGHTKCKELLEGYGAQPTDCLLQ